MKKFTCNGSNSFFCYLTHQGFYVLSGTLMSVLLILSVGGLWYSSQHFNQQQSQFMTIAFLDELD